MIILKNEKLHFLKSSLIFTGSVLCQFIKNIDFLLVCWFLAINLTKFSSPKQNLHNPPDIILLSEEDFRNFNVSTNVRRILLTSCLAKADTIRNILIIYSYIDNHYLRKKTFFLRSPTENLVLWLNIAKNCILKYLISIKKSRLNKVI